MAGALKPIASSVPLQPFRDLLAEWGAHVFAIALIGGGCFVESQIRATPGIPVWVLGLFDVWLLVTVGLTLNIVFRRHVEHAAWRWLLIVVTLSVSGLIASGHVDLGLLVKK